MRTVKARAYIFVLVAALLLFPGMQSVFTTAAQEDFGNSGSTRNFGSAGAFNNGEAASSQTEIEFLDPKEDTVLKELDAFCGCREYEICLFAVFQCPKNENCTVAKERWDKLRAFKDETCGAHGAFLRANVGPIEQGLYTRTYIAPEHRGQAISILAELRAGTAAISKGSAQQVRDIAIAEEKRIADEERKRQQRLQEAQDMLAEIRSKTEEEHRTACARSVTKNVFGECPGPTQEQFTIACKKAQERGLGCVCPAD